MMIHPQYLTLGKLFEGRLFRIPEYQRTYSWGRKQRADLFGDIRTLLDRDEDVEHFMATVVVLRREKRMIVADEYDVVEVVDGQQRLTTLVILYRALAKALNTADATQNKLRERVDETLVKGDDVSLLLLQTNHDTSDYFVDYVRAGDVPDRAAAKTLAAQELANAIHEAEKFVGEFAEEELVRLLAILRNRLAFVLHVLADEGAVYTVFEVLNSRGLAVAWLDRLKSMLMALAFESDSGNEDEYIEELHRIWSDTYRTIGLRREVGDEAMRFAATLRTPQHRNKVFGAESAAQDLRAQADTSAKGAVEVSRWIGRVVSEVHRLRSNRRLAAVTNIVHARLVAVAIRLMEQENRLSSGDAELLLDQWERSTFRIFGLGRRDARTKVGDYVRLARSFYRESLDTPTMLDRLRRLGSGEFSIENVTIHLDDANCYEGWQEELRYLFFRYEEHLAGEIGQRFENEQWARIWEVSPSNSIEHIEPQSKGHAEQSTTGIFVHRLGNLVLLPPGVNSIVSDKSFEEKLPTYLNCGLLILQDLVEYATTNRWGRNEVEMREEALIAWIVEQWSDVES